MPVIGFYGGRDQGIPLDGVRQMQEKLKEGSSGSVIEIYPEAGHGFFADYRESYNKAAAEDAWNKLIAWFQRNKAL